VQILDFDTGEVIRVLDDARGGIGTTPNGKLLVCCDSQGNLQVWDTSTWTKTACFDVEGEKAICAAIPPEGHQVACGTEQGSIFIFTLSETG
jgi:WD40 repeat protein